MAYGSCLPICMLRKRSISLHVQEVIWADGPDSVQGIHHRAHNAKNVCFSHKCTFFAAAGEPHADPVAANDFSNGPKLVCLHAHYQSGILTGADRLN